MMSMVELLFAVGGNGSGGFFPGGLVFIIGVLALAVILFFRFRGR
jgi:hypothetical protein